MHSSISRDRRQWSAARTPAPAPELRRAARSRGERVAAPRRANQRSVAHVPAPHGPVGKSRRADCRLKQLLTKFDFVLGNVFHPRCHVKEG